MYVFKTVLPIFPIRTEPYHTKILVGKHSYPSQYGTVWYVNGKEVYVTQYADVCDDWYFWCLQTSEDLLALKIKTTPENIHQTWNNNSKLKLPISLNVPYLLFYYSLKMGYLPCLLLSSGSSAQEMQMQFKLPPPQRCNTHWQWTECACSGSRGRFWDQRVSW